jgi:steroid delta-isomerase-like uncharacterized protein
MSNANKQIIRREFEEILNEGNDAVLDELIDQDYVLYDPTAPAPLRGPNGLRQSLEPFRAAFPDLRLSVEDQVAEGDKVATRWIFTGRHDGDFFGIPPTGKQVEVTGISIERVAGGRIVEDRMELDALGLMRQLGAVPGEPAA